MKKAFLLVAVAVVAALSMIACNKDDETPQQPSTFTATEQYNDTIIIRYVSEYADAIERVELCVGYRNWCYHSKQEGGFAFIHYNVWAFIEKHPEVLKMVGDDGVLEVSIEFDGQFVFFKIYGTPTYGWNYSLFA